VQLKDTILNSVTAITGVCAVVVTIQAFMFPSSRPASVRTAPRDLPAAEWRPLTITGHRIGPENAKFTIVEFGDFQCPVCGVYEHVIDSMRARYPNDFAVVFHQFPLSYHPLAYPLARAAECAGNQGRFTAFHDSVYANQRLLGIVPLISFGARAGITDTAAFSRCLLNTAPVLAIENDLAYGKKIDVPGTPAIIVNGVMHSGDMSVHSLGMALNASR
jgi:Na+:H+ antiporter, NhaA family